MNPSPEAGKVTTLQKASFGRVLVFPFITPKASCEALLGMLAVFLGKHPRFCRLAGVREALGASGGRTGGWL